MLNEDRKWEAVEHRDASQDGKFVYAVTSTGVYCRPTCPSRRPLRKNVRFFDTLQAAERAGFRACRRCHPERARSSVINEVVHALARHIDANPDQPLRLADLAKRAGYSAFHLQRNFKSIMGSTPKEYQTAARLRTLKKELRKEASVSAASDQTPLGLLMIGATDRGICFLQFGDTHESLAAELGRQFPAARTQPMPPTHSKDFDSWMAALNRHLRGLEPRLDLPLDVRGTAFQLIVWRYLQKLPYGEVRSYSEVAEAIGKPSAVRAVAGACASNKIALLIPCHRVVRGTGELGGYRWGVQRKRVLLDTERAAKSG
jgi:AraC family transcriptional regulator, regulatory protein of adaptative response / methylated-DNA-[protein]-cysteine methyltransferase